MGRFTATTSAKVKSEMINAMVATYGRMQAFNLAQVDIYEPPQIAKLATVVSTVGGI